MKKKPVTGMKDITPREMEIRDYVIRMIKDTYGTFGFSSIETPCVEHIENLSSKQGGENEKLIFKILKRGEKLKIDTAETEMDLVDGGLRYDLTVPLSRYYANNANNLPSPFKALQMGNVWRADRPQRGRYRQFMQCDIDILGEPTILAEIELILATSTLVGKLDFENFTIRINDRRILKAMAACSGFPEESYDTVFIILDKMDKIGKEGVAEELEKEGFARITIDNLCGLLQITKGAFYHHFKNIDGYVDALMRYWLEVNTFEFIREVDKLNTPKEQQQKLADMAAYASIRNESVIRAWGYSNPIVRNYVVQADSIRLEYANKLNEAIGLDAKQAMDLAIIQYSMLIGMQQVCSDLSAKQFKELQDMVINKFKKQ